MKKFRLNEIAKVDSESSFFDRQERIGWWKQENLSNAKVMVVGAGAIGNETLKNLALMGFGYIFVVDFDTVSKSNLSRTVLFKKEDIGKVKSEIAAFRVKEMALAENFQIDWFNGNAVWELGTGIYREMDIILGCLDNLETRVAVNRNSWLAEKPWIDAGINQLACRVNFYLPPYAPCYECSVSRENLKLEMQQRYSCDNFKKKMHEEGKVATVQISSSIVAALQVQEAVKYLCGEEVEHGKQIYYQGKFHDFDINSITEKKTCETHHLSYPEIIEIPLGTDVKLKDFLAFVSRNEHSGLGATLDFTADIMFFVKKISCRYCHSEIEIMRPNFKVEADETVCSNCKDNGLKDNEENSSLEAKKEIIAQFSLENTDIRILELSLMDIGIPYLHVVAVFDNEENYKYYQLSGDKIRILPNLTNTV